MVCVNDVLDHFERYKAEQTGHDLKKKHQQMNVKRKQNL